MTSTFRLGLTVLIHLSDTLQRIQTHQPALEQLKTKNVSGNAVEDRVGLVCIDYCWGKRLFKNHD